MFDPRMLQDPLLMALLQQLGQQSQQPMGGMGAQSNPNIIQDPGGVYRNIQPSNEPPALPFAAPGDYATEQYLAQLAAEQQARQAQAALEMKAREAELSHSRGLELEGMKQTGSTERQKIQSMGEIEKQRFSSIGSILNNENLLPEQKISAIQQLVATGGEQSTEPDLKAEAVSLADSIKKYNTLTTPAGRAESLKAESKDGGAGVIQSAGNTYDSVKSFYNQPGKLKEIAALPVQGLSKLSTIGKELGSAPQDIIAAIKNEKFSAKPPQDQKVALATEIAQKLVLLGKAEGMTPLEVIAFAKAKGLKDPLIFDLISRM